MRFGFHSRWLNLQHTLWFLPSVIAACYIALAEGLVRLDAAEGFRSAWVFEGSGHAARTVLSVIAGSLMTVAGVTFSVTMIVLQLTSTQFSPRVLRNYIGDRIAQLTIGSFIGIFAYCLLALRSIGNTGGRGVPRLTVTVASGLALVALAMLIVFIHHIAQLVQASEVTARLGRQTLAAIERLYPEQLGKSAECHDGDCLVERWRMEAAPGFVYAEEPGFVQAVELRSLAAGCPSRGHASTSWSPRETSRTWTSRSRRSGPSPPPRKPASSCFAASPSAASATSSRTSTSGSGS